MTSPSSRRTRSQTLETSRGPGYYFLPHLFVFLENVFPTNKNNNYATWQIAEFLSDLDTSLNPATLWATPQEDLDALKDAYEVHFFVPRALSEDAGQAREQIKEGLIAAVSCSSAPPACQLHVFALPTT